jgi:hypothetical protein
MDLVIARYNENIDWLNSLCQKKLVNRIFIYNKGNDIKPPQYNNIPILIESRPNEGRDPETYFYHILKYYDNIKDHILFSQANPFDHIKYVENRLLAFKQYPSTQSKLTFWSDHFAYDTNTNNPRWEIVYRYLFYGTATDMVYSASAQYLVSPEAIKYRSKAFYTQVLSMFKNAEKIIGTPGIGINKDAQPGISAIDLMAYPFEGILPIMWDMTTKSRN